MCSRDDLVLRAKLTLNELRILFFFFVFFVLFFFGRAEPGRRAKRFAVVEYRQVAHVKRQRARGRFLIDDDGDRAPLDALAERDAAATGESRVRESLQHSVFIISRGFPGQAPNRIAPTAAL